MVSEKLQTGNGNDPKERGRTVQQIHRRGDTVFWHGSWRFHTSAAVDGKGWEKEVSGSVNLWPTVRYMEKSVATVDPVISRWECNTETLAESGVTAANCFVYKIE